MANILGGNSSKSKLTAKGSKISKFAPKGHFNSPLLMLTIIAAFVLMGLTYALFSSISATETYYVLGSDIPAHSQITPDMLQAVKTRKGTAPRAISIDDVQSGQVYAQYDLLAGDILTHSNTGGRASIYNGVSDSWSVTSFTVDASDAVDGNITRGDYFDILGMGAKPAKDGKEPSQAVKMGQGGSYVYYNVMCLFTTAHKNRAVGTKTAENQGSSAIEYFVAMPPKDIAMLHAALNSLQIKLVMSPRENQYKAPTDSAYMFSTFEYNNEQVRPRNASLCDDSKPGYSSDCTDNTFLDVRRNKFGVPYNAEANKLDENGNLVFDKDAPRLTKAEMHWCDNLFSEPYYLGSRWDSDKQYCRDQAKGTKDEKKLTEKWAKSLDKAKDKSRTKPDDASGVQVEKKLNPDSKPLPEPQTPDSKPDSGDSAPGDLPDDSNA